MPVVRKFNCFRSSCLSSLFFFSTIQTTKCYFEDGFHDTKIYLLEELSAGHTIDGPAIIVDKNRFVACGQRHRRRICLSASCKLVHFTVSSQQPNATGNSINQSVINAGKTLE